MNNREKIQKNLELKKVGIIAQKQEGYYAIRFLSDVGYFSSKELLSLAHLCEKYGSGELGLTSRLTIEVPYIKEEDLETVVKEAKDMGLRIGGTGATVRAIVACKGSVCKHGLIDTRKISREIEKRFFAKELPYKFKIGVFGCINSYGKAQSNDLAVFPIYNKESSKVEFKIFIGGRLGREPRLGTPMNRSFEEKDIMNIVEATIEYYKENAKEKERFSSLIERVGLEKVEDSIIEKFNYKTKCNG